jgi:hypothetical protein
MRSPGRCLAITDALLFDETVTDAELATLGLALDYPDRAPKKSDYKDALPMNDAQVSNGRAGLAKKRLAYLNRGRVLRTTDPKRRYRPPVKLERIASHADPTRAGVRFTLVPIKATKRLKGTRKGALPAWRLLALYCREQRMRGAVQMPDEVAAWMLGWSRDDTARARKRLLARDALVQTAPARGGLPPIYKVPDADFGPERKLEPDKTRLFHSVAVGDESLTVYGRATEVEKIALLVRAALGTHTPAQILGAIGADTDEPIDARDLFAGPLERLADRARQEVRKRQNPDSGNATPPAQETSTASPCPFPHKNLRRRASRVRDEGSTESERSGNAEPRAETSRGEKAASTEDQGEAAAGWHRCGEALADSFERETPHSNIAKVYDWARWRIAELHDGYLTAEQLELADSTLAAQIRQAKEYAGDNKQALHGLTIKALRRSLPDEVHEQLKRLRDGPRAWPPPSLDQGAGVELIDVSDGLDDILAAPS